jgi:hypothetical protein
MARTFPGSRPAQEAPMMNDPLLAPLKDAVRRDVGGVVLEAVRAGDARVKRTIYPAGFTWETHMKPLVGTALCMHAHVGFLARGRIGIQFADGCTLEFVAPQVVVIEPGHIGWVVGNEAAVLIEVDFEGDTARRFGLPEEHRHD